MALEEAWLVLKRWPIANPVRQAKEYDRTGKVNLKPGLLHRLKEWKAKQAGLGRLGREAQRRQYLHQRLQLPMDLESHRVILEHVYNTKGRDAYDKLLGEMNAYAESGKTTNDSSFGNTALRGAVGLEQKAPPYVEDGSAVAGLNQSQPVWPGSENFNVLQQKLPTLAAQEESQQ